MSLSRRFGTPKYGIIVCLILFAIVWNSTYMLHVADTANEWNYYEIHATISGSVSSFASGTFSTGTNTTIAYGPIAKRKKIAFKPPLEHYACTQNSVKSYYDVISKTDLVISNPNLTANCNCFLVDEKYNKKTKSFGNKTTVCVPTFFIIGVAKCGTSSLYYYLMEDERFISGLAKELWHTHVPYANHLYEDFYSPAEMRGKYQFYLPTFNIDGYFDTDVQCDNLSIETSKANTYNDSIIQQACKFHYNDRDKYLKKLQRHQYPVWFAYNESNKTIPPELVPFDKNGKTDIMKYKKSVVYKKTSDTLANKHNNGMGARMLMTTDATPDYHFYADVPEGLKKQFPTSKIILINRDILERSISIFRFASMKDEVYNLTEFVDILKGHRREYQRCIDARKKYKIDQKEFVLQETNQHWMLHVGNTSILPPGYVESFQHDPDHGVYKAYLELFKRVDRVANPCHFQPFIANHNNVYSRFHIYSHMKWWLQFYDPEQILVIDYEMLKHEPKYVLNKVLNFLELSDTQSVPDYVFDIQFAGPHSVKLKNESKVQTNLDKRILHAYEGASTDAKEYVDVMKEFLRNHSFTHDNNKRSGVYDRIPHINYDPIPPRSTLNVGEMLLNHPNHHKFWHSTITKGNIDELNNLLNGYDYKKQIKNIEKMLHIQAIY